jgi:retinol dehydrogenase 12
MLLQCYNPGNLESELQRHSKDQYPAFASWLLHTLMLYPVVFGAYTEIYSGLSPDLTLAKDQGGYIVPWGRRASPRPDIVAEAKKEGGQASKLYDWCEKMTAQYL